MLPTLLAESYGGDSTNRWLAIAKDVLEQQANDATVLAYKQVTSVIDGIMQATASGSSVSFSSQQLTDMCNRLPANKTSSAISHFLKVCSDSASAQSTISACQADLQMLQNEVSDHDNIDRFLGLTRLSEMHQFIASVKSKQQHAAQADAKLHAADLEQLCTEGQSELEAVASLEGAALVKAMTGPKSKNIASLQNRIEKKLKLAEKAYQLLGENTIPPALQYKANATIGGVVYVIG